MLNLPQLSLSPTLLHFTPLSTTFPPFPAYLSLRNPEKSIKKPRRYLRGVNELLLAYLLAISGITDGGLLVEGYWWRLTPGGGPIALPFAPLRNVERRFSWISHRCGIWRWPPGLEKLEAPR
jgi:hypothetical protein